MEDGEVITRILDGFPIKFRLLPNGKLRNSFAAPWLIPSADMSNALAAGRQFVQAWNRQEKDDEFATRHGKIARAAGVTPGDLIGASSLWHGTIEETST